MAGLVRLLVFQIIVLGRIILIYMKHLMRHTAQVIVGMVSPSAVWYTYVMSKDNQKSLSRGTQLNLK